MKICKNCGHDKSCHNGATENQCIHVKYSGAVPTQENICGCKNFVLINRVKSEE